MEATERLAMLEYCRRRIVELERAEDFLGARVLVEVHTMLQKTAPENRPPLHELLDLQETG